MIYSPQFRGHFIVLSLQIHSIACFAQNWSNFNLVSHWHTTTVSSSKACTPLCSFLNLGSSCLQFGQLLLPSASFLLSHESMQRLQKALSHSRHSLALNNKHVQMTHCIPVRSSSSLSIPLIIETSSWISCWLTLNPTSRHLLNSSNYF